MEAHEFVEIDVAQAIGVGYEEFAAKVVAAAENAITRISVFAGIDHAYFPSIRPALEIIDDDFLAVTECKDEIFVALSCEYLHDPDENGLAAHRHHGFRQVVGVGVGSSPAATGKNENFHGIPPVS